MRLVILALFALPTVAFADIDADRPEPPPPPPPPPPPQNVPPTLLEGYRISGEKHIVPSDVTKIEIARSGKTKVVGSWKLCITVTGTIAKISRLKSTGFSAYDTLIEKKMADWRYRPYLVNGKAVSVCTAVTFIYTQVDSEPTTRVSAATLEKLRLFGSSTIRPDDDTLVDIEKRKLPKVVGNFALCINDRGSVTHARTITSTGFTRYDEHIVATIKLWEYKPYVVRSAITPACSTVTIIHTK